MRLKILLTGLTIFWLVFSIYKIAQKEWQYWWTPYDLKTADYLYNISQYVRKGEEAAWIADETLFSYAGWHYINGSSPVLINPENPPLGKYIVGLSIKYFNSEKIPTLIFGFLTLLCFFLLSRIFLREFWSALLPVAIFSSEVLFYQQMHYMPLFELFALTFLFLSFIFFIKGLKSGSYFILANFFIGILWAVRPWMATVPLILVYIVYLLLFEKKLKNFLYWCLVFPVALVPLLLSYLKLILEGWSLYKVLSVQKWILWYHQSRLIKYGSVWPFIYLRRWYVWWGEKPYFLVDQWNVFWPIFTTLALIFSLLVLLKSFGVKRKWLKKIKFDKRIRILCLWVVFYLAFLSIGNINTRYVFYLLPFCYLLGVYFLF